MTATFSGPAIWIVEPTIDFSLLKINSTQAFWMNLENISNIEAWILVNLPGASFDDVNFETSIETKKGNRISYSPIF